MLVWQYESFVFQYVYAEKIKGIEMQVGRDAACISCIGMCLKETAGGRFCRWRI